MYGANEMQAISTLGVVMRKSICLFARNDSVSEELEQVFYAYDIPNEIINHIMSFTTRMYIGTPGVHGYPVEFDDMYGLEVLHDTLDLPTPFIVRGKSQLQKMYMYAWLWDPKRGCSKSKHDDLEYLVTPEGKYMNRYYNSQKLPVRRLGLTRPESDDRAARIVYRRPVCQLVDRPTIFLGETWGEHLRTDHKRIPGRYTKAFDYWRAHSGTVHWEEGELCDVERRSGVREGQVFQVTEEVWMVQTGEKRFMMHSSFVDGAYKLITKLCPAVSEYVGYS
jgi:hypothetical protein